VRASVLKLSIPKNVNLKVETDNYPMSFSGMENKLKLTSENAPVSIHNSTGDMHIESENGPVRLHQCQGNLYAKMENGPLSAEAITGESVHLHSENGPIKLRLASYSKVEVETENGQIYYETQPVENGDFTFKTENGIIHLVLPVNFDFELKATTESGKVKSQLNIPLTLEDETYTMVSGSGGTKINISTENGSIKLSNDGHINIDYAKEKIEQLKEALRNANSPEEKEKVLELMNKVVEYLTRVVGSFTEDNVKEKVNAAIIKLKLMGDKLDLDDAREKIVINIEDIGAQISEGLKEGIKGFKSGFDEVKQRHFHHDHVHEYIRKVMDSPLIKPYLGGEMKNKEKDEVADRSRLKILDMLEAGKISAEEAERLLRAIGKE